MEDELARLMGVQNSQNNQLQAMQDRLSKAYGLEDTVKRQELVIEKLENMIRRMNNERKGKQLA